MVSFYLLFVLKTIYTLTNSNFYCTTQDTLYIPIGLFCMYFGQTPPAERTLILSTIQYKYSQNPETKLMRRQS